MEPNPQPTQPPQPNYQPPDAPGPSFVQPPAQAQTAASNSQNPSSGLAIASLVLSIIGFFTAWIFGIGILLAVLAIIFGIVALAKKQGGKGLSITGIVIGAVTILIGSFFLLSTFVAYNGIQDRAKATQNMSMAARLQKKVEVYNVIMGSPTEDNYPSYQELVNTDIAEATLDSETLSMLHEGNGASVSENRPLAYQSCAYGAVIYYYDVAQKLADSITAGNPSRC